MMLELTTSLIIEMPSLPLCFIMFPVKLIESALVTLIIPGNVSVISYLLLCQLPSPYAMYTVAPWTVAFPCESRDGVEAVVGVGEA